MFEHMATAPIPDVIPTEPLRTTHELVEMITYDDFPENPYEKPFAIRLWGSDTSHVAPEPVLSHIAGLLYTLARPVVLHYGGDLMYDFNRLQEAKVHHGSLLVFSVRTFGSDLSIMDDWEGTLPNWAWDRHESNDHSFMISIVRDGSGSWYALVRKNLPEHRHGRP